MSVPPRTDIPRAVPPRSRAPLYLGLTALGAAGYYFYQAGGDATVAKKKAEVTYHKAVDTMPGNFQGHPHEKTLEEKAAQVGATVDRTVSEGKARINEGVRETEQAAANAKAKVLHKIDEADLKIEKEAAKAKSGIMSWFGK